MSSGSSSLSFSSRYISKIARQSFPWPSPTICLPCRIRIQRQQKQPNFLSHHKPFSTSHARSTTKPEPANPDPHVTRVPDTSLPSHRLLNQSPLSKTLHSLLDKTSSALALASHRINTYTGTDYSAISSLRLEIAQQEQLVKARYGALQDAKTRVDAAQDVKARSAAELVALLERKQGWSGSDLEAYMALVRSEHANDAAVQGGRDAVSKAEAALEEARVRLEKRERAQYHEEQIWSDTIRRNSTWVTFGLMGLNIGILLVNLVVVEPWRRRRLVREVRSVLEEGRVGAGSAGADVDGATAESVEEQSVDVGRTEAVESVVETVITEPPSVEESLDAIIGAEPIGTIVSEPARVIEEPEMVTSGESQAETSSWSHRAETHIRDLFGDQLMHLRKVEITIIALQSAAVGASIAGIIFLLIKPR